MRTRLKICGIRTVHAALAAAAAGADAIGLVFVDKSPRVVTMQQARAVLDALPAFVQPVGLFVDRPVEQVLETAGELGLTTVQLHGSESPDDVAQLNHLRVVKALGFADVEQAWSAAAPWLAEPPTNLCGLMFDATPQPDAAIPGGSGRSFDWSALRRWADQAGEAAPPLILAGGLTPGNVGSAISIVRPYAVDVSSGVEATRGEKDVAKIAAFAAAVRAADRAGGAH